MKKIFFLVIMSFLIICNVQVIYAGNATVKMSVGKEASDVGEKIEVSMDIESDKVIKDISAMLIYDESMLEYVSSSHTITRSNGSLKIKDSENTGGKLRTYFVEFKVLKKGITQVEFASAPVLTDEDGEDITTSFSSLYIETKGKDDTNNSLEKLRISPGTLNKKFDKDVASYSLTVDNKVTEVVIDAKASSDVATVEVKGDDDLKVGSNNVKIIVTAESGDKKEYIIKVKRLSKEEQKEKDEKEEAEKRKNRTVIYKDGEQVFLENDSKFEILDIIETETMKIPVGYKKIKLNLYGVDIEACVLEKNEENDVVLLYAKNTENGYEGYYSYDKVEKTFQRYFGDMVAVAGEKSNELFEKQEYEENVRTLGTIVATLVVLLVITLIIIIKLYSDIKNIKNDNYLI